MSANVITPRVSQILALRLLLKTAQAVTLKCDAKMALQLPLACHFKQM